MIALSCGIKNIAGWFFGLVTKHACDLRTGGITTPKTALSIARAVKIGLFDEINHSMIAPLQKDTLRIAPLNYC